MSKAHIFCLEAQTTMDLGGAYRMRIRSWIQLAFQRSKSLKCHSVLYQCPVPFTCPYEMTWHILRRLLFCYLLFSLETRRELQQRCCYLES